MSCLDSLLEQGRSQSVSWDGFPHHLGDGARAQLYNTAFLHLQVGLQLRHDAGLISTCKLLSAATWCKHDPNAYISPLSPYDAMCSVQSLRGS
jgi:hypothetical protein